MHMKYLYRKKILVSLLVATLIPLITIISFIILNVYNQKKDEVIRNNFALINSNRDYIERFFLLGNDTANQIQQDYKIIDYVGSKEKVSLEDTLDFYDYFRMNYQSSKFELSNPEYNMYDANNKIKNGVSINIYSSNSNIIATDFLHDGSEFNPSYITNLNKYDVLWKLEKIAGKDSVCMYKQIYLSNDQPSAYVKISFDIELFKSLDYNTMPDESFVVFSFEKNPIILNMSKSASSDINTVASNYEKGNTNNHYFLVQSGFLNSSLLLGNSKLLMFIPRSYLYKQLQNYLFYSLLIAIFVILIIIFSDFYISRMLTKNLYAFISSVDEDVEKLIQNNQLQYYKFKSKDEIDMITTKFYDLLKKTNEYNKKILEYQIQKKKLETELLQSLFNPHFLYNTLACIKYDNKDKPELSQLIDSLVLYYRIALNKGNFVLKISDELKMANEYINIQKFAYCRDFDFEVDVDEEIKDCLVIKNLLQPFIENAFIHGINAHKSGGKIKVSCNKKDNNILINISDNGVGMTQEKADELLTSKSNNLPGGYGILNAIDRIKANYGDEYGVSIESEINVGTLVRILIPIVIITD